MFFFFFLVMALAGGLAVFWSLVGTAHLVFSVRRRELKPRGDTVEYLQGKFFRAGQKTGGNDPHVVEQFYILLTLT